MLTRLFVCVNIISTKGSEKMSKLLDMMKAKDVKRSDIQRLCKWECRTITHNKLHRKTKLTLEEAILIADYLKVDVRELVE